ncbi:MAG: hypothetical protein ABEJ27_07125 [Halodesulfurarchaeum sp.]
MTTILPSTSPIIVVVDAALALVGLITVAVVLGVLTTRTGVWMLALDLATLATFVGLGRPWRETRA